MWFNSGDMLLRDTDYHVYFVDRIGDTFRSVWLGQGSIGNCIFCPIFTQFRSDRDKVFYCDHTKKNFKELWALFRAHWSCPLSTSCVFYAKNVCNIFLNNEATCDVTIEWVRNLIAGLDFLITLTLFKIACPLSGTEFYSGDWIHFQTQSRYMV